MNFIKHPIMLNVCQQGENGNTNEMSALNISNSTVNGTIHQYSTPELIDIIVTPDTIEHVYKRHLLIWLNQGNPQPEVYKIVYSRHDGSEKTVFGKYIAPSREQYQF